MLSFNLNLLSLDTNLFKIKTNRIKSYIVLKRTTKYNLVDSLIIENNTDQVLAEAIVYYVDEMGEVKFLYHDHNMSEIFDKANNNNTAHISKRNFFNAEPVKIKYLPPNTQIALNFKEERNKNLKKFSVYILGITENGKTISNDKDRLRRKKLASLLVTGDNIFKSLENFEILEKVV